MFALTRLRLSIAFIAATASAALLALAAFSSTASATHQWGSYHWASTTYPMTLILGDNLTSNWDDYLRRTTGDFTEASDYPVANPDDWDTPTTTWNDYTYPDKLKLDVLDGKTNNTSGTRTPKKCAPTAQRVEVCNAAYGNNGWLGLAQIWISGDTITQGTAKLNDSYFGTTKYNTRGWKNLVMCQEVGHTFGLAHVNETYNTPNEGTCMDYSDDPDGGAGGVSGTDPTNEYPNKNDYKQLAGIYGSDNDHSDPPRSTSSTSAASDFPAEVNSGGLDRPQDWGQLKRKSANGAVEIYERDLGKGKDGKEKKLVTRVIRVAEKIPTVEASERPKHDDGHTHEDGEEH